MFDPVATVLLLSICALSALFWWAEYRLGGVAFGLVGALLMGSALLVAATAFPRLLPALAAMVAGAIALLVRQWWRRTAATTPASSEIRDGDADPT